MRLDRKFFLILPAILLVLVVGGLFYTATRLQLVVAASENWSVRDAYIAAVQSGRKTISAPAAVQLVRLSLDAEARRTAAINAARETLLLLAWVSLAACAVLLFTIRRVPRQG